MSILPSKLEKQACLDYFEEEGLIEYFKNNKETQYNIFDTISGEYSDPFAPEVFDLYRLHKLIRHRKVFNVLEFGIGWSTLIMADALRKNKKDFQSDDQAPNVRIKNPFKIYSVDASKHWIETFSKNNDLDDIFELSYSSCSIGEFNGQICHYYDNIPNVVTDFIYLDGPSPTDVKGKINGISFENCIERTVMSADLLKMEPAFLPGTMILTDGRTNNARFLKNNFKRNYTFEYSEEQDVSAFELCEEPLGKINRIQIDYCLGSSYYKRIV